MSCLHENHNGNAFDQYVNFYYYYYFPMIEVYCAWLQISCLEEWAHLERDHSSSLLGATEALKASTLRLPIVEKAIVCATFPFSPDTLHIFKIDCKMLNCYSLSGGCTKSKGCSGVSSWRDAGNGILNIHSFVKGDFLFFSVCAFRYHRSCV